MANHWKNSARRAVNALLNPLGLHLQRASRAFEMEHLLARAAARGFRPGTVVDVGASDGVWSLLAHRHFPDAKFLLFEPLTEHATALATLRASHGFIPVPAVAGASRSTVAFAVAGDLDGSGVAGPDAPATRTVPVMTVADATREHAARGPYCLKLDTHGYELPVLAGAEELLPQTELIIIEAYNFNLTDDCLRFPELCTWLEHRGFRCCDLADPMSRPGDGVLWQVDLAFAPSGSAFFASNRYE